MDTDPFSAPPSPHLDRSRPGAGIAFRRCSLDNVVATPHISGQSTPDEMAPVFPDYLPPSSRAVRGATSWTAREATEASGLP